VPGPIIPLIEDGIAGEGTLNAIEKFQRQMMGMANPMDAGQSRWLANSAKGKAR